MEEHILMVIKSEMIEENAFNGHFLEMDDRHESSKDEKSLFEVFLKIFYSCFNP